MSIRLNRQTTSTVLMRLRTADNLAGGRVFVAANGTLYIRSDVAGRPDELRGPAHRRLLDEARALRHRRAVRHAHAGGRRHPGGLLHGGHGRPGFGMVEIGETVNNNWSANFDDLEVTEPA